MKSSSSLDSEYNLLYDPSAWTGIQQKLMPSFIALSIIFALQKARPGSNAVERYDIKPVIFSGFVVQFHSYWFFVTAGHVLTSIDSAISGGYRVCSCKFHDGFAGKGDQKWLPVPFSREKWMVCDSLVNGIDLAVLPLGTYERKNFEANGVKALGAEICASDADRFERYGIIGIPSELSSMIPVQAGGSISTIVNMRIPMIPVRRVDSDQSQETLDRPGIRFVGEIESMIGRSADERVELKDITGMSGGPVFGFKRDGSDVLYKLVGLQSVWKQKSKLVGVVMLKPFFEWLETKLAVVDKME